MSDTETKNYCEDTYYDALTWDSTRIEREQSAISAYLVEHWPTMSESNRVTVLREKRAFTEARREQIRRANEI